MKKHVHLGTLFALLAILFIFLYGISPSYVDENGILHESFGFIPLAYISLFLAMALYIEKFFKNK